MNSLNKTESAVFLYCMFSLFLKYPFSRLFNTRNKLSTQKLLKHGYLYYKFCKTVILILYFIEWGAKGGSYLTEVQWDISDLPFVRNKDFQNKVRHVRWGVFNSDCLYAKITLLSFITVC